MKKENQKLKKASVYHIIEAVGKLYKVPTASREDMITLSHYLDEHDLLPWYAEDIRVFPWITDVVDAVFRAKKNDPLIQEMVMFPGDVMWAKDLIRSGGQGIWLVFAEDAEDTVSHFHHALRGYSPTMLVSHIKMDDATYRLAAIQASTLQKI